MSWFGDTYTAKCVPVLMKYLGESTVGTYTDPAGGSTQCLGIVTNIGKEVEDDDLGRRLRIDLEWIITTDPEDDNYGGVSDPETKATVTLGGVEYSVHAIEAVSESLAKLSLVRLPIKYRSREGFRRA